MCGIAGVAGNIEPARAFTATQRMMATLARRGPDGEGIEVWAHAALGHRRLAIFDLTEAGRQPMMSPDGSIGIVFNGAIYNFHSLREDLRKSGYQFRSESDTEVLVHGYRAWGIDALVTKLRGMFAFGLWDDSSQKLFLVRDRLGVKPLLFAPGDGQVAFASSVRALRAGGFAEEIDQQAIVDFLEFGFVTEARTIYEGVYKVPAASILEWSSRSSSLREYWQPPSPTTSVSFKDAVSETEGLLLKAVERRMAADVPVGTLLSGGVDSSLVCWALSELGADLTAFTVGTPDDSSDETPDAKATARQLGIRHKVINISADEEPNMSDLVSAYAEPFACSSALGMLRVSRAVKGEATVLLTGDGGDDVFLGYNEHWHLFCAERLARVSPSKFADLWKLGEVSFPRHGPLRRIASLLSYAAGGLGAVTSNHDGLPSYKPGVLGERLNAATVVQREIDWSHESAKRLLSDFLEYDRHNRFVAEFLTKVDGATMHYGLEARSPFLDQELWEFASALPFGLRLQNGTLKAVLRELARQKLGGRVARGVKRGFTIPVQNWIVGKWRNEVERNFKDSILAREGWISSKHTLDWLGEVAGQGRAAPKQLWFLYVLESWLKSEREIERGGSDDFSKLFMPAEHLGSAISPQLR